MAPSLRPLTGSPNSRNAASSGMKSDSRCAASLRTTPAWRTASAIAMKPLGSSTPSAASTSHGVRGVSSAAGSGRSTAQQSRAATAWLAMMAWRTSTCQRRASFSIAATATLQATLASR